MEKSAERRRRSVRADARANRATILAVAFKRFAIDGSNATMDGIAQEAGVAVGTLYHHFGTKEGLLEVVVQEGLAQATAHIHALLDEPDAWMGVERLVRFLAEKQWNNHAFQELIGANSVLRASAVTRKRQLGPVIQQVLDRAKAAGQVRADVMAADIPLLLAGASAEHLADDVRERYLSIVLHGLRA